MCNSNSKFNIEGEARFDGKRYTTLETKPNQIYLQTNTINKTLVGLNRIMITFKLIPDNKEEGIAIEKTSTASANDKQMGLVEKHVLNFYHSLKERFVLINASVKKDGTVDMMLEKTGGVGGI